MNEKLLKIINDHQLVSVMNRTKWRELCDAFSNHNEINPSVRYKYLDSDELLGCRNPLLNLRLLKRRNFFISIITRTGLGLGLYGSTFILPLYLVQIQGYNAMRIGETIMWAGVPQLFVTPFFKKVKPVAGGGGH